MNEASWLWTGVVELFLENILGIVGQQANQGFCIYVTKKQQKKKKTNLHKIFIVKFRIRIIIINF